MEELKLENKSFMEDPFIKENLTFAFGKEQIQEAIKKLGAKSEDELTSIFGVGDVCLISNASKNIEIINKYNKKRN